MRRRYDVRTVVGKFFLGLALCASGLALPFLMESFRSGGYNVVVEIGENGAPLIRPVRPVFDAGTLILSGLLLLGGIAVWLAAARQHRKEQEARADSEEKIPVTQQPDGETLLTDDAQKKREELARLLEAGLLTKEEYRERLKKME